MCKNSPKTAFTKRVFIKKTRELFIEKFYTKLAKSFFYKNI